MGQTFCSLYGRWEEWEDRLLTELSLNVSHDFHSALTYCFGVVNHPWPELESVLLRGMLGPDIFRLPGWNLACLRAFVLYVRHYDESPSLELEILKHRAPAAAFAYAAYGIRRRWEAAEKLILDGDTSASPALSLGPGDFLDPNQWRNKESQAVTYAQLFLKSGWPALEAKMADGKCHPQVACEYAEKILKGPLPDPIRNWLVLESFDATGSTYRQQYLAFETAKRAHLS